MEEAQYDKDGRGSMLARTPCGRSERCSFHRTRPMPCSQVIARLCRHYNVPLVSMRGALLQAVRDDAAAETRLAYFMHDCKHPTSQGHTYLAQMVIGRILATESAAGA
eukprot:4491066-Prymnesium_polylepis.1